MGKCRQKTGLRRSYDWLEGSCFGGEEGRPRVEKVPLDCHGLSREWRYSIERPD